MMEHDYDIHGGCAPGCRACEIERLTAEVERLTQAHERLRDLARHQRGELLEAGLITRAEYADLLSDSGSVKRLEMYDQLKAENARLCKALERIAFTVLTQDDDGPVTIARHALGFNEDGEPFTKTPAREAERLKA